MTPEFIKNCQHASTCVIDSRKRKRTVYRRRQCKHCGEKFTTIEAPASDWDKSVLNRRRKDSQSAWVQFVRLA